jgi:hypothetical protein
VWSTWCPEALGLFHLQLFILYWFCQTFAPYTTRRQPTTPEKANCCTWGTATWVRIVQSGESFLDQERLYYKWGSTPAHP